ncbi:hypothetical protein V6N11_019857 [Hibiscus sabdariffa]|uniref:Uncharacterized protein n=1 Tax=Hibiscus sabdariffa TaxID=183260 RepID=A0ABR2A6T0_9ROSI
MGERLLKVHVLNHRGEERKRVLNQCYDIKAYSYLADIKGNCEGKPERCRLSSTVKVRDFVRSNSHSSKDMDSFQDSVFYLDKSVMECNLPELVVCYKENTYHVIKDIRIDDGVLTKDMFLFDNGTDEKFLPSEKDLDAELMKDSPEMDVSINGVSRIPEQNQSDQNVDDECGSKKKLDADTCALDVCLLEGIESNDGIANQCDFKDLILTREMKDGVSKVLYTLGLGELTSMSKMSSAKTKAVYSDCKSDAVEQQSFQNFSEREVTAIPSLDSAVEESDPGKGEPTLVSPVFASVPEESSSSCLVSEVSNDSKLESGRITCHFNSSAPTSNEDECSHNLDGEPHETGSTPKLGDAVDQPFSSNLQRGNGESSFSLAGPVSGLITYSGPIAYSGNLSLRSDSSATSTRSFAFPILQPEWDSSPVRMAKADRRHYRKHRGWRQGILCCRF